MQSGQLAERTVCPDHVMLACGQLVKTMHTAQRRKPGQQQLLDKLLLLQNEQAVRAAGAEINISECV